MFGAPGSSAGLGPYYPDRQPLAFPIAAAGVPAPRPHQNKHHTLHGSGFHFGAPVIPTRLWQIAPDFPQTHSSEIAAQVLKPTTHHAVLDIVVPVPGSADTSSSRGVHTLQSTALRFSNPFEDEPPPKRSVLATGAVHTPNFDALAAPSTQMLSSFMTTRFVDGVPLAPLGTAQGAFRAGHAQQEPWTSPTAARPLFQQGNSSTSNARRRIVSHAVSLARSPTAKVLALTGHCSLGDSMNCLFHAWATKSADGQLRIQPLSFAAITALHGPPAILSHIESFRYFNLPLMMSLSVYAPAAEAAGDEEEDMGKVMQLAQKGPVKAVADLFGPRSAPMRKLVDDFFGTTPVVSTVTRFSRTNMTARSPATYVRSTAMKTALRLYRSKGPKCFDEMKQAVFEHVLATKPWLDGMEGGLTLDQWQRNFGICPRCTVMRIERSSKDFSTEGAQNLCLGIIRTRPSKEFGCLGTHVRCCDHYQWKWCPGFEVTGNDKCREAPSRSDSCPRYFARSTIWKHQMKPGEEKTRGAKRDREDDDF